MSGNPSNLQVRYGFEQTEGLGDPATWVDVRLRSESMGAQFPGIEDDSIIAGADQPEKLESKIDPSGAWPMNVSPEDHAKGFANFFGAGDTPSNPGTGVYVHPLANYPHKSDIRFGTMAQEISRDLGEPELNVGGRISQIQLNLSARNLLTGQFTWLHPSFHAWDDPVTVTVGGSPVLPYVRGLPRYDVDIAADPVIFGKVTTGPSGQTMAMKFKVGTAASYTGPAVTVTEDQWTSVVDASGQVGQGEECPIELLFTDISGYALNDIIKIPRPRPVWSQNLPLASALNEIAAYIYVDGQLFNVNQLTLTMTRPVVRDEIIGGRFIRGVVEVGQRTVSLQLTRRALDLDLARRLRARRPFQFRLLAQGAQIGSTAYRRAIDLLGLNFIPEGKTASVGGRAQFDEQVTATAHPSSDVDNPAPITCTITNTQSNLAA